MKSIIPCFLFWIISWLGISNLPAQNKITLSHLGVPTFYTNFSTAITAAVNGDTLYLPGGQIQPTTTAVTINKSLHIIGTGHYPDSTAATGRTVIYQLKYITGCSGGSIQGCAISDLQIGNATNQNISGLSVTRCKVDLFRLGSDNISTIENIILTDNCFMDDFLINLSYPGVYISRNVFSNSSGRLGQGLIFKNNIFYDNCDYNNSYGALKGFTNCLFENNILIINNSANFKLNCTYSSFNRNLFIPNITDWGSNSQQYSLLNQTLAGTFENAPGTSFSYGYNYHLKSTSPGVNYGTDGTSVGIYGTNAPYKEGAVPFNPHIFSKNISGQTSSQGILNVNISVSAQDR